MLEIKRWDFTREGDICPTCNGTGQIYEERDMHRSGGWAPCPGGYFNGHGRPVCVGGKLTFSNYDKENQVELMKNYK